MVIFYPDCYVIATTTTKSSMKLEIIRKFEQDEENADDHVEVIEEGEEYYFNFLTIFNKR